MKSIGWIFVCFLLAACAHVRGRSDETEARLRLWVDAHDALSTAQFGRADTLFTRLARDYTDTETGRESLFYLGVLRMDPRNPAWSSERAETALQAYLSTDTTGPVKIHRRPEGQTLHEIARQLNLPSDQRVRPLQTDTTIVVRQEVPQRVAPVARVATLEAEVADLRAQLESKDGQIRRLQEELERIRRTLSPPGATP